MYEIKYWELGKRNKITRIYTEVTRIWKQNSALQQTNKMNLMRFLTKTYWFT
jgi:hypothetical protein